MSVCSFSAKRKEVMEDRQRKLMSQRLGLGGQAEGTPLLRLLVSPVIHKVRSRCYFSCGRRLISPQAFCRHPPEIQDTTMTFHVELPVLKSCKVTAVLRSTRNLLKNLWALLSLSQRHCVYTSILTFEAVSSSYFMDD